ncbi:hypothetical protein [Vulcanisaeta sp. JCM 16161]|uniref:hypothetical protein n=1 Tax=Vulcanisaeta sp. JCM 16161 TaxID=1295372 RepID=UPI000B323FEC|nr:hypothetical protein [Vulcanisaeta sp. JCM 16161]
MVQLYLSLLIPAIIVYLINAGVIRVMGLYSAAFNGFLIAGSSNLVLMIMGVINLVLSTWLIVSVSYLQLRIATRRIVSRLGSAIGSTVGIAASTGTAAFVGSACGLGVCTVPISGVSPMAMVFMSIFDINALELIHYSSIVLLLLMLITSILLVIIHKSMVRGL